MVRRIEVVVIMSCHRLFLGSGTLSPTRTIMGTE
jgi:hypothetical protein